MNKALLLPILAIAIAFPALAAPPSTASVDKLLELQKVTRAHSAILAQIQAAAAMRLKQALRGQEATPADQAVFAQVNTDIAAAVDKSVSEASLRSTYEKIYTELYTQEEIDGLIAFYSTPVGSSYAEKQLQVSQKTNQAMQQLMMPMFQTIGLETQAAMQKLLAAHQPPAPPAATTPAAAPAHPANTGFTLPPPPKP